MQSRFIAMVLLALALKTRAMPEEFANLVVFLASERASYITGVSIPVRILGRGACRLWRSSHCPQKKKGGSPAAPSLLFRSSERMS